MHDTPEYWLVFHHSDPTTVCRAYRALTKGGFRKITNYRTIYLCREDATPARATEAANLLIDRGFTQGVCT